MYVTCMIITIMIIDTVTVPVSVYKQSSISSSICVSIFHKVLYLVEMHWIIVKRTHLIKKKVKTNNYDIYD